MRREAWVSVRDDFLRQPKPSVDVVEVELCNLWSGDFLRTREENRRSQAPMVDDGEDRVVSIGLGEPNDKVHGYLLKRKGSRISGDFVHRGARAMGDDLVLLTRRTSLDVFCDPGAHVRPPVVSLRLGDGFVASGVPSY